MVQKYRLDILFILLIIAAGLLGIFYRLDITPPGNYPWSDESDVASDAVASLRDGLEFHYPAQLAGGPVAVWLQTGWMALFGTSLTGLRILNGLVNLVSVLLLYLLVRQLPFGERLRWPFPGPSFNHWLALTAALLFANSTWILGLARIATPNWSLVPPTTTLTFYFLWLALKTNRQRYFIATGIMMGWAIYNYIPAYFIPFVPAIFLALIWRGKVQGLPHPPSKLYLLPFPVAFAVALPILTFFALHPVAVMQRVVQLAHTNEIADTRLMGVGVLDTFSAFGVFPNWVLQGRFEHVTFDPFLAVLFIIGLVIAIRRRRDPVYLFVLLWWVVMIMPAFLSRSASLGFIFELWRRGIGAQPVSFVFPALTVMAAAQWLQKKIKADDRALGLSTLQHRGRFSVRQLVVLPALVAVVVLISTGFSYWLYFERWANSGVVPLFFAAGPVHLVDWMEAESDADTLFIFPKRSNVSPTVRPELFTVRYLFDGVAAAAYPFVDETTLDQELADLFDKYRPTKVHLMLHNRIVVDPKDYFGYALGWRGEIVSQEKQPDYNVITYRLYDDKPLEASSKPRGEAWSQAANIDFGQSLRLIEQRLQPETIRAGRPLGVALRWAKITDQEEADYNVSLALYNTQDDEVAKADKPLLSSVDHMTTRYWQPGDEATIYYLLPMPPDSPPGRYALRTVAYNAETGERLSPRSGGRTDLSYTLAEVRLEPNPEIVDPATLTIAQPMNMELFAGLHLIGIDIPDAPIQHPGELLQATVLWQTSQSLTRDIGLGLDLVGPDGDVVSLFEEPQPLIADYSTTMWPVGSVYRTNYKVLLPATLSSNDYQLTLRLVDLRAAELLAEQDLFPLIVEARPHVFDAPSLANQLNIDFGDAVRLRSFEFGEESPDLLSGEEIQLKLQWQALREISESYKVFLHLTDVNGQIVNQVDTLPQKGIVPTTSWVSGEIIEDELAMTTPPGNSPASYRLVVGLYNVNTGERLKVGQRDQLVLVENGQVRQVSRVKEN